MINDVFPFLNFQYPGECEGGGRDFVPFYHLQFLAYTALAQEGIIFFLIFPCKTYGVGTH